MRSVMDHNFAKVPPPRIQRSMFNLSRGLKTTMFPNLEETSKLYPIFCSEVLPGDTFTVAATFFARFATLLRPIMDNVFFETFWFFVPNRLVWDHWERFIGVNDDTNDAPTQYEVPVLAGIDSDPLDVQVYSVFDYFGLPLGEYDTKVYPNVLPLRAYNLIWNEWFRPEYLADKVTVAKDDGPDTSNYYQLWPRAKRHDYFTSCLPWPQKGDAVELPLGTTAPVQGTGMALGLSFNTSNLPDGSHRGAPYNDGASGDLYIGTNGYGVDAGTTYGGGGAPASQVYLGVTKDSTKSGLVADLSAATAATINQLREAFMVQELFEIDAKAGGRYVEQILGHFGVVVPDFRLQRPEYLGGSSSRLDVRGVPQTSESGTTKQASLAAYGQLADRCYFHKSFVEHGHIIGLANVRADITYQQGLERMWSRSTRFDFYFPALAHLGEQAVLNKELCFLPLSNPSYEDNQETFGFQERWSEYRYGISRVTGQFRSAAAGTLDSWHLALEFDETTPPQLDYNFIMDAPPFERISAVTTEPKIILDAFFDVKAARPMPVYSVPARLGRF